MLGLAVTIDAQPISTSAQAAVSMSTSSSRQAAALDLESDTFNQLKPGSKQLCRRP